MVGAVLVGTMSSSLQAKNMVDNTAITKEFLNTLFICLNILNLLFNL